MIGNSIVGSILVKGWNSFYYSWSPPVANAISGSPALKGTFSVLLAPLLGLMHIVAADYNSLSWISPDLAAIHAFTIAALLSIIIYILLPASMLWFIARKIKTLGKTPTSTKV
jgi:hypothetical protein